MALIAGQVNKILLDTGVVYINGNMLAPCEGDNSFVVDVEYRNIPYNGSAGKTKGLKRILRENAILTVHPKGLTQSILNYALPGSELDGAAIESAGGRKVILDAKYIDEVVLVGDQKDGNDKGNNALQGTCRQWVDFDSGRGFGNDPGASVRGSLRSYRPCGSIYTIEDAAYYGS